MFGLPALPATLPPRGPREWLLAALLLAAVAGCATERAAASAGGDVRGLRRGCEPAELPVVLPSAADLVDSLALAKDLRALQLARDTVRGEALLSMAYDNSGLNVRRTLVRHTLPRAVADSLQQLVFAHRKMVAPGQEWGAQLQVGLGNEIRIAVKRQTICPPQLRRTRSTPTPNVIELPRRSHAVQGPRRTVRVRVLVDENGRVQRAKLVGGVMDSREEAQLLSSLYALTFEPGLEDGVPTPAWTTVTIRGLVY